ncbi:hypothetical protein [Streptomyces sp. NPDC090022]|uniref:hypothetical protein n=1 Tax=Streptomyces sp. NPDC090022 TaxID=3365920 RepID=UPI0037F57250
MHDRRRQEVTAAAWMVRTFRSAPQEYWDELAVAACDEHLAYGVAETVAEAGQAVAAHADRLLACVRRRLGHGRFPRLWRDAPRAHDGVAGDLLLALAGLGDVRAAPLLGASLEQGSLRLLDRRHAPTVAALPAAALLPALRASLRTAPERDGHQTSLDVLGLWGPAAAAAVPELLVHTQGLHARPAVEALGRIGPGAADAAEVLADLAAGRLRPYGWDPDARPWHGDQAAAWAHWRVTGDDTAALAVCGAAARAGLGRPVLRYLADLGPAAARYADAVRALLDAPGRWTRVGAAHAWWRITGEAGPAVPVLVRELDQLERDPTEFYAVPTLEAVGHLGAIGTPAAAAAPVLHRLLSARRRTVRRWPCLPNILEDEALRRALTTTLTAVGTPDPTAAAPA